MNFSEIPIPPRPAPPPEALPEHVIHFNSSTWRAGDTYVNEAYRWLHRVALGEVGLADGVDVRTHGQHTLVLLPRPVRFIDRDSGFDMRALAAILFTEQIRHANPAVCGSRTTGWMIDNHAEAIATYELLIDPAKAADLPDDDFPYLPEADEDDDA